MNYVELQKDTQRYFKALDHAREHLLADFGEETSIWVFLYLHAHPDLCTSDETCEFLYVELLSQLIDKTIKDFAEAGLDVAEQKTTSIIDELADVYTKHRAAHLEKYAPLVCWLVDLLKAYKDDTKMKSFFKKIAATAVLPKDPQKKS